ncbi:MAG: hypothetical protein QF767_04820, partial [Alphaproteobacteria bacterium]|nr:hypothetical protein [Alphaproteobacteria bacterium]
MKPTSAYAAFMAAISGPTPMILMTRLSERKKTVVYLSATSAAKALPCQLSAGPSSTPNNSNVFLS